MNLFSLDFQFLGNLLDSTIGGLPLIFFIPVVVFAIRKLSGWDGRKLTWTALVVGLVSGVLNNLADGVLPANLSQWISMGTFAVGLGAASALFYDLLGAIVVRGVEKYLAKADERLVMSFARDEDLPPDQMVG